MSLKLPTDSYYYLSWFLMVEVIMVAFQKSWALIKLAIKQSKVFVFFSLYTVSTNNAVEVGLLHFLTLYDCLESSRVDQLCTVKSPTEKKQKRKSKQFRNKETLFSLHSQLISQKSVSLVTSSFPIFDISFFTASESCQ